MLLMCPCMIVSGAQIGNSGCCKRVCIRLDIYLKVLNGLEGTKKAYSEAVLWIIIWDFWLCEMVDDCFLLSFSGIQKEQQQRVGFLEVLLEVIGCSISCLFAPKSDVLGFALILGFHFTLFLALILF